MQKNLFISQIIEGFNSPEIDLNAETGVFRIKGESYVENAKEFYAPVLGWLEEFVKSNTKPITVKIELDYYNTSSSRSLQDIFTIIRFYQEKGNEVTVNWYYDENYSDEEISEEIEDFEIVSGVQINLVKVDPEF